MKLLNKILIGLAAVCTAYAVYNANHIMLTRYNISSDKLSSDLRVLFITDLHYGNMQTKGAIAKFLSKLEDVDVVLLVGDIVDENTSLTEANEIFSLLSGIRSKYGVFYVDGNHDFVLARKYGLTIKESKKELYDILTRNNIVNLNDSMYLLREDVALIGVSDNSCCSYNGIVSKLSKYCDNRFTICMEHRPEDIFDNESCGVDLQVSGHLHGGQIFPYNLIKRCSDDNPFYGIYKCESMKVIVSSGAGVSKVPMRTAEHCEVVLVNITSEK